jgi:Flp pilus assembly protein TadB
VKKFLKRILLLTILILPLASFAQDSKKDREIERMKEYRQRETFKAYKKAVKRQWKIQSPEVRKKMRADLRKAKKYNYHRKDFFLKRWFTKKSMKKKGHEDTTDPNN